MRAAEAHEISASKGEMMSSQLKPLCTKRNRSDVAVLPIRALLPRSAAGDWGRRQALEAGEELQGSKLGKADGDFRTPAEYRLVAGSPVALSWEYCLLLPVAVGREGTGTGLLPWAVVSGLGNI